jgi:hypothetical protein
MNIIMNSREDGLAVIGVVYGNAGIGKSVSILSAADSLLPQSHTGLPGALLIEIFPDMTVTKFLQHILFLLDEKPLSRSKSDLLEQVIHAIIANDIRLIVFDEANWFTSKTFEYVRYINGRTKCPVLLVGLKTIVRVIEPYEQLDSRAMFRREFPTLTEDEALSTFFPGITLPRWSFNPDDAEDIKMGRYIWKRVKPSLRRAYALIYAADKMAELRDKPRVNLDVVQEAFKDFVPAKRSAEQSNEQDETLDPRRGEHEERSEQRHRKKNSRRKKDDDA